MKKNAILHYSVFKTPEGPFSVAVDAKGSIVATAFGKVAALKRRLRGDRLVANERATRAARTQIKAWFSGRRRDFTVGVSPEGSPFQKRVWAALKRIPYGETRSYGDIAKSLRSSPRAVGRANATNPVCLIVPCHRVIGADGSLTGFAFGENTKRRLLDFEAA